MRAVTYVSPGEIDIIEKPIPKIEPDEVLLEVLGAGVCHSDLNIIRSPKRRHLIGTTLGHETAGRVVEVGSAVTTVDVGEEVLSFGLKFCDRCRECLAGRQNQCMVIAHRRRDPLGHGLGLDGGHGRLHGHPRAAARLAGRARPGGLRAAVRRGPHPDAGDQLGARPAPALSLIHI